ncbi:MAG: hypothetical protein IKS52_12030 [Clostridia bacterium]|nr:hypothetical protein [Clostridia bacterium]MBO4886249.1 hypothetical protein [Clostridia bacterium]MBR4443983.1 hypothetical protein [Clostridia bacterium]
MAATYDTGLIREAARQVQAVSRQLDEGAVYQLKQAQEVMETCKGQTAEALGEQLVVHRQMIRADLMRLADIAAKLNVFANALDDADKRLTDIIRGRG